MESDVLTSVWRIGAWGDGSSSALCVNILCDACEVVVASDLPIDVAMHIAALHNAAISAPPVGSLPNLADAT